MERIRSVLVLRFGELLLMRICGDSGSVMGCVESRRGTGEEALLFSSGWKFLVQGLWKFLSSSVTLIALLVQPNSYSLCCSREDRT
jgi:hypothetical protein